MIWKIMAMFLVTCSVWAQQLLIPMDLRQDDHLKAYGITFWALEQGLTSEWLLNYRGGSFLLPADDRVIRLCRIRGVSTEIVEGNTLAQIYNQIESSNMESIRLEKSPAIAVYAPPANQPWDDAVTLVLSYAEIPFTQLWDEEVLHGELTRFDWLHLHHEDFTGQYGKFYSSYRHAVWYRNQQILYEKEALRLGYKKVSKLKLAVAEAVRNYVVSGGFLFAMCSATDSYDIALAAADIDICDAVFDGDGVDSQYADKLNYSRSFAFENFKLIVDPMIYEYSNIDTTPLNRQGLRPAGNDYFTLFEFSAKYDPVPTMLTQNHVSIIHNFMGQTTAFNRELIKPAVVIMAKHEGSGEVKYLHGIVGQGTFTYYGGHDPEDYQHFVGDPPTDLSLHRSSPGYRLILNNILFPAAKKKKQKT
ncbi:asparagine synthetase B [bacterium]|nr:asparagine synthetase B [bacterium]